VLLSGETGTGKELFARVVHRSGPAHNGPFVAINCAAIPPELLEAELFGVERHVATGVDPRAGLFIAANGGTMFLDEIGDLEERLQAKILRVLQEREVLAVGATRPRKISVRIVSASNRDLGELVARGRFRADLYYRLRGLEFHIPPLRSRFDDIPLLALEFLARASEEHGKRIAGITDTAIELLKTHPWPGNVRELQSEVHRAVLLCGNGDSLRPEHFTLRVPILGCDELDPVALPVSAEREGASLRERVDATERDAISRALRKSHGNRSVAAKALGITRNGLANKVRRLGLQYIDEP
jgi:two-component system response regulator HupR/HoxA